MKHAPVIVYSSRVCPYCVWAKKLLASKDVAYEEIFIDRNPDDLDRMVARSGGRMTVPQIFIGETHVGGFDDLSALDRAGELDALLFPDT